MIGDWRVLVTGAGGFVCRNIVEWMLEAGHAVVAVDRSFDVALRQKWQTTWDTRLEILETNSEHLPDLAVDALIHGAAITATPDEAGQTPEANFRANIDPLLNALQWGEQQGVRRSIFISSGAVYRETPPGPIYETTLPSPYGMYAIAKHTMETLVETLRDQYGRDAIVIRLGSIYGPGEFSRQTRPNVSLIGRMVREAVKNGRISVPESGRSVSWTFAPDIGRAAEALLRSPRLAHHLYNAVSGEVFTPQAIAHEIKNILPDTELAVQPVAIEAPPRQGYLANDRLQQEIGFDQWTGLADGLRQTITYFQEHEGI